MSGVGFFGAIVIGIVAGWIAGRVFNRGQGLLKNLIVGLVGSLIGGALVRAFAISAQPGFVASLVVSTIGAIVLLFLLGLFDRRR
ncbi:GlsB/YeaQ/YmgE family stress response membrane protein [Pseudoxanthobacter sp.]|uniref:GlsB/YeaQ/YmgE family stress response membrane protein n=1 Tax=Pseudoxanthobacter sp. TaxID=1925742 RepID=UPI002FDFF12F